MSAAIRRAWRKPRRELPFHDALKRLEAAGCNCKANAMQIGTRNGKPFYLLPGLHMSTFETISRPDIPGGGNPPRRHESISCSGCGTQFTRVS